MKKIVLLLFALCTAFCTKAQINIELLEQFNGRYDFTFVGNTLNNESNKHDLVNPPCIFLPSSSANLNLPAGNTIHRAYLYWAGSGGGDYEVSLNGQPVTASRQFPVLANNTDGNTRPFFSAFADVTPIVQAAGNGSYTFADLDLSGVINENTLPQDNLYCTNGTNFGGWAIVVVYQNPALPLNQLNLYDGLQFVPTQVNITLNSLNVIDDIGAKIGLIAWEGDPSLTNGEGLFINGDELTNALNPAGNAFNGTNSITNSGQLYNMDLDIYDIEDHIAIGDATAEIQLTSNADFVMISTIVTKLNSQLPDATVVVDNITMQCNSRTIQVAYTVSNINSTDVLPAGTAVSLYANGTFLTHFLTTAALPIGGSQSGTITLTIPNNIPVNFELLLIADNLNGIASITETDETNNSFLMQVALWVSPPLAEPADITECETFNGSGVGIFNFSAYGQSLKNNPTDTVTFYASLADAQAGTPAITNTTNFPSASAQHEIFVRLQDVNGCFSIKSFLLIAVDCSFPDATVTTALVNQECNSRIISVAYTVFNLNSADILPAGTPVSIYANGIFIDYTETLDNIAIGGSESESVTLTIPPGVPLDFDLVFVADDIGDGSGIVVEANETNNSFAIPVTLWISPILQQADDIINCNEGFGLAAFDFSGYEGSLQNQPTDMVTFYLTQADADAGNNSITNTGQYTSTANPQQIFVRLQDGNGCFTTGSFAISTKQCPPETYNYVTPNNDGYNDGFFVKGLRNIFLNFKMSIYNRWGSLVWTGNHAMPDWDGIANEDKVGSSDTTVPTGTYYFVLELNDPAYPKPIVGWVYVTR